jgi:hypothetical protein
MDLLQIDGKARVFVRNTVREKPGLPNSQVRELLLIKYYISACENPCLSVILKQKRPFSLHMADREELLSLLALARVQLYWSVSSSAS